MTLRHIVALSQGLSEEELRKKLAPDHQAIPVTRAASATVNSARAERRWSGWNAPDDLKKILLPDDDVTCYAGSIENFAGVVTLPVGVAGPLRVNGLSAKGDYLVPLATTEAALVASYHRGCRVMNECGGSTAMILSENVNRAPVFLFHSVVDGARFIVWVLENYDEIKAVAESTTSHGKLIDVGSILEGNHVYLNFEYHTGDASGQNMVTIATQAVCDWVMSSSPVKPNGCFVESNLSGDKKASARGFTTVRGRKVTAEVRVSAELLLKHLHVSAQQMEEYWQVSAIGGVLSGTMGVHGHFANGLAALYLATGQDAACVAESTVGVTRFEASSDGSLYAAVTLPGIMVGTVGGGTRLPTQQAWLNLMGLGGAGKARALAEVCASLLLAGEISIIAALSAGHFSRAHHKLARKK